MQLAVLLSETNVVRAHTLHFDGAPAWQPRCAETVTAPAAAEATPLRGRTLGELEEMAIRAAHERHRGNRRAISRELGIARSSL